MKYEEYIDYLESSDESPEVCEKAVEALSFVKTLHDNLKENGANLPEEPDVDALSTQIDMLCAELAAASLFLSEDVFARVPKMLRSLSETIGAEDEEFTDSEGITDTSVPVVVRDGFKRFADRIEATRVQKKQYINVAEDFKSKRVDK